MERIHEGRFTIGDHTIDLRDLSWQLSRDITSGVSPQMTFFLFQSIFSGETNVFLVANVGAPSLGIHVQKGSRSEALVSKCKRNQQNV